MIDSLRHEKGRGSFIALHTSRAAAAQSHGSFDGRIIARHGGRP
jgi:hypothetical protein